MITDLHLTLEVLHYIQKHIIDIRSVVELNLDSIEIAKRIGDIELTIGSTILILWHGLGGHLYVNLLLRREGLWGGYRGRGCWGARPVNGELWGGETGCRGLSFY